MLLSAAQLHHNWVADTLFYYRGVSEQMKKMVNMFLTGIIHSGISLEQRVVKYLPGSGLFRICPVLLALAVFIRPVQVSACTEIYVGAGLTDDGSMIFGRLEEYTSDIAWPKTFDAVPSGLHKTGEEYLGCYGFRWTFTHDSYGYTAFCDNISQGVCPDCGGTHEHTPYQAGGTNEKGLSVSATETLIGKEEIVAVDPFNTDSGIEEAEITTILLSEAATAREAMELLTMIFSETGSYSAGSVIVADTDETWYIESLSGTQYVAVKLNEDLLFVCPNMSVIGVVDLDDSEHICSSERLIETAVRAGTFVGDADAHRIDYAASYEETPETAFHRLLVALNYLSSRKTRPSDTKPEDTDGSDFRISNTDSDGNTVLPYTNIRADKKLNMRDVMDLFKETPISRRRSLETHLFQIRDESSSGILEWISMGDNRYSVFVPYEPMHTTEVFEAFRTGTAMSELVEEKPAESYCYATDEGLWGIYPEGWKKSYYWVFTALEHIAEKDEDAAAHIADAMSALQDDICQRQETGNAAAGKAYQAALDLCNYYFDGREETMKKICQKG